jgi:hypothetical protein
MVAINEIFKESAKLLIESVFEVESGTIMSTGNNALGYNVVDTRLDPTNPNYIVRTFDNASAAQNYNNTINLELSRNSRFDPRTSPDVGTNDGRIGSTGAKPPLEWDDLKDDRGRLPRSIQNQLRNPGYIEYGGHRYTRQEIEAFTQAATARRAQWARDADATRAKLLTMTPEDAKNPTAWARNNRTLLNQVGRSMVSVFPFSTFLRPGVQLAAYEGLKELLANYYTVSVNDQTTPETVERDMREIFGLWFVTFVVPDLVVAVKTVATWVLRAIVRVIRAINFGNMAASQVAGFFAGLPGAAAALVKNIIQFIAVEAAIYLVLREAVKRPEFQLFVMNMMKNHYVSTVGSWGFRFADGLNTYLTPRVNEYVIPQLSDFNISELQDVEIMTRTNVRPEVTTSADTVNGVEIPGGQGQPIVPKTSNDAADEFNRYLNEL